MNCEQFQMILDDLLDGTLEGVEADAASRHAATCRECGDQLARANELAALVEQLPRSVDPSRDLWSGIAYSLRPESNVVRGRFGTWGRSWMAAAALAVAAVGSILVAYTIGRHHAPVVVQRSVTPLAVPARAGAGSMAVVEAEFREARDELFAALRARESSLSPETMAVVNDNLLVIDAAIQRISQALGEDPDNPMLTGQLTRAYQQQIQLLRRANRLPAEI